MTDPLDMRLDHAMTIPFCPTRATLNTFAAARVREADVPNPYQRMRFARRIPWERPPKPKQLAGVMLGPECRRQWQQALAPFARVDETGLVPNKWFRVPVFHPGKSVQQRVLFEVWASVSRGQFIHTWQFAVRGKP